MTELSDIDLGRSARRLRVDTLVRLRWLAMAGQTGAVLVVAFALGFDLPLKLWLESWPLSIVIKI